MDRIGKLPDVFLVPGAVPAALPEMNNSQLRGLAREGDAA